MRTLVLVLLVVVWGCMAPSGERSDSPRSSATANPVASQPPAAKEVAVGSAPDSSVPPGGPEVLLPPGPPPVTVHVRGQSFDLRPWTYCYLTACVDGMPPTESPDVGGVDRVAFDFPLDGWTFEAQFERVGVECPRRQLVPVAQTGDRRYLVRPAGFAGTYDVTLFGRGNGDLFVTFRWTTPHDGPLPVPTGRLALIADHDGRPDSYGVELELSGLRSTPATASAAVTVTAANGRSLTLAPERVGACLGEGAVYWNGPEATGREAAALGPAPFRYDVVVVLDGARHTASSVWPRDVIEGFEPSVRLTFSPPLPALP